MEIITADWETYYDKDFSVTKITMEEYIRSDQFECILLGLIMPDGVKRVITGTHAEIQYQLDQIDWGKYAVLCHNTLFDAAIFSWIFNVRPRLWLDTMGMGRAMFGGKGNSLKALAERFGLEEKGTYVANMQGRRRESLSEAEFLHYSTYCLLDCQLTFDLWTIMSQGFYSLDPYDNRGPFPKDELKLIDKIIRMFTEPVLHLNVPKLEEHYKFVVNRKAELIEAAGGVDKAGLMSNNKFAELLQAFGVEPPTKVSPKTGKVAFAFAKTDEAMKALLEHPKLEVQALVAARLGVKTTIEETRTARLISIGSRGKFPVPLRYGAARTHRLGGCLVAGSLVWVYDPSRGQAVEKRIVDVLLDDLVWDGEEFVQHEGVSHNGYAEVITHDKVCGTKGHRVFTANGERTLEEAKNSGKSIQTAKHFSTHHVEAARRLSKRKS